ncbi:MAG: prepilin-type N-terminal cleavage/methylation domain-containing protein [Thermoguttaceae bacterium]
MARPQASPARTTEYVPRGLTLLELLIVLTILVALSTIIVPTMGYLGRRSQSLAARENLYRLQELIVNRYWADMGELPRPAVDVDGDVIEPDRLDHPQLRYLFVNPDRAADADDPFLYQKSANLLSGRTWQGPYLSHSGARYTITDADGTGTGFTDRYGEDGDPAVLDAWGRPIVLQVPDESATDLPTDLGEFTEAQIRRLHARLVSAGPNGRIETPTDVLMPSAAERGDDVVVFLFRHDEDGDGFLDLEDQ